MLKELMSKLRLPLDDVGHVEITICPCMELVMWITFFSVSDKAIGHDFNPHDFTIIEEMQSKYLFPVRVVSFRGDFSL